MGPEAGLKATGLKTRRELADFALRLRHKQQKKRLSLKIKVTWEGNLEKVRNGTALDDPANIARGA